MRRVPASQRCPGHERQGGGFFARTMMKIMGTGMMRKALAKDLAALKAYVEGESR